jgi:plasmid stabilization system protein ParE
VKYTIEFSPEAQDQLDELEALIAVAASPAVAARYVDAIVTYCGSLETFPERGTRRDDLLPGLRITSYRRRVVIAFLVDTPAHTVSIVGIFYGGQDYEARLLDD